MMLLFIIVSLSIALAFGKLDGDGAMQQCDGNEIFTQCSGCERNCSAHVRQSEAPNCRYGGSPIKCGAPKCECAPEFARSHSGKCVRIEFCEPPLATVTNDNRANYHSSLHDDDHAMFRLEKAEYNRSAANASDNEVVGVGTVKALGI